MMMTMREWGTGTGTGTLYCYIYSPLITKCIHRIVCCLDPQFTLPNMFHSLVLLFEVGNL